MADRSTQFEKALLGLRSLILEGAFEPNSRLPEVALSERLGLSRTPLRRAMDRLIEEGLLERIETGGCRVARFTFQDIIDSIELRGVVEGTAARLAAERGVPEALMAQADGILARIDSALAGEVDFDAYVEGNAAFHDLLAQLAGSPVIQREATRIRNLPLASPSAFLHRQDLLPDFQASLTRAQVQHRAMIEAIAAREGSRAEALAREHARLARQNLEYLTRTEPGLAPQVPGLALVSSEDT
ncbi:GntR family transcriptional regulator [Marinibacterium profundimaris]|uniref:GntR family transcriptional regulator n=1 Tax=Marinibacterium profundimaris TaxID=1679460 RepID=A0A225NIL4_9RHOB|nr:GntR family transcriptional regulator [Marinibacterium profundimaris]OWU72913.1 GntR family transcriptional regulator [Marinibacterium profundimaris]